MELKVNYDDLDSITKETKRNESDLEIERRRLLESLERLKESWAGDDVDIFYEKAHDYIDRMKVLCEFMTTTSDFITEGNRQYQAQEEQFSKELEAEKIEKEIENQ